MTHSRNLFLLLLTWLDWNSPCWNFPCWVSVSGLFSFFLSSVILRKKGYRRDKASYWFVHKGILVTILTVACSALEQGSNTGQEVTLAACWPWEYSSRGSLVMGLWKFAACIWPVVACVSLSAWFSKGAHARLPFHTVSVWQAAWPGHQSKSLAALVAGEEQGFPHV